MTRLAIVLSLVVHGCTADQAVRACVAENCGCAQDSDCVIEPCYFDELPYSWEPESCESPTGDCSCWKDYDCTNGYPVPATVRDEIAASSATACDSGFACDVGLLSNCGAERTTHYSAECRLGLCVGVAEEKH